MGCGSSSDEDEALQNRIGEIQPEQTQKRPKPEEFDFPKQQTDVSSSAIKINFTNCNYCQACARACSDYEREFILTKSTNSKPPYIGQSGKYLKLATTDCIGCGLCILQCPNQCIEPAPAKKWLDSHQNATKYAIVSPSTQVYFEGYNLVELLQSLGYAKVFSVASGLDLVILSEARHICAQKKINRVVLSSICPAFTNYVERKHPELMQFLSPHNSPDQILAGALKLYIAAANEISNLQVVSFGSCVAQKLKNRFNFIDCTVTNNELEAIITEEKAKQNKLQYSYSAPFDEFSRSSFGYEVPGTFSEALAREIFELYGDDFNMSKISTSLSRKWDENDEYIKICSFQTGNESFEFAIASGGVAVEELIREITNSTLKVDFAEFFMCPLGCANGGGSIVDFRYAEVVKRVESLKKEERAVAEESIDECEGVVEFEKECMREQEIRTEKYEAWE